MAHKRSDFLSYGKHLAAHSLDNFSFSLTSFEQLLWLPNIWYRFTTYEFYTYRICHWSGSMRVGEGYRSQKTWPFTMESLGNWIADGSPAATWIFDRTIPSCQRQKWRIKDKKKHYLISRLKLLETIRNFKKNFI